MTLGLLWQSPKARCMRLIPDQEVKIPHALCQKNWSNKFNKNFKNGLHKKIFENEKQNWSYSHLRWRWKPELGRGQSQTKSVWPPFLYALELTVCDGSFYVSTWLGHGAQIFGQTLFLMFLWGCLYMRFVFKSADFEWTALHNVGKFHPISWSADIPQTIRSVDFTLPPCHRSNKESYRIPSSQNCHFGAFFLRWLSAVLRQVYLQRPPLAILLSLYNSPQPSVFHVENSEVLQIDSQTFFKTGN